MKTLADALKDLSPEESRHVNQLHDDLERTLPLGALRRALGFNQKHLAKTLGISQAAVSKIEGRGDALLSTVFDFVTALGGKATLRLDVGGRHFCVSKVADLFRLEEKMRSHDYRPETFTFSDLLNTQSQRKFANPERDDLIVNDRKQTFRIRSTRQVETRQ